MEVLRMILEEKQNDYKLVVTFPEMSYEEAHLQEICKTQLQGRRQKYNESLQEYEANIMRLINLTYPTYPEDIKRELVVNSYIEGLCDPETSQTLTTKENFRRSCLAFQFETAKCMPRNQRGIIRRVKVSQDDRKTNE